jgi:Aminopeptidase N
MMRNSRLSLVLLLAVVSCARIPDEGVSYELALERGAAVSDVSYTLRLDIPEDRAAEIPAREELSYRLIKRCNIVLDFRETADKLSEVSVNGQSIPTKIVNGHIIIPRRFSRKGENRVTIVFTAGELSLNRRDKFMYTLLVPDRACTLFPCFDQPDIKATYSLSLEIPEKWTAVSNSAIETESVLENGRRTLAFGKTEPLSTYLFSFVCGEFQRVSAERGGRTISIYHRETDAAKAAQCGSILNSIFDALDYLEEYTAMPYPFSKYDCVAIPDFQYGGMEHTGATLYNDRRLFLDQNPTTAEIQGRESLIAHETAHMWFGDCVTMKWFNDVWTKEVFANWFAARITRPKFPQINFIVSDLYNYYSPSYDEDRTTGSNAIQRPLDNLKNAGLIYCNIIYDKAPVVLEKLNEKMGEEAMRDGVRDYLRRFAYGNADWDDLIEVLGERANFDVDEWSRVWIKEKGMPEYDSLGNCIDPFGKGNIWQQDVVFTDVDDGISLANLDGRAYGCFRLNPETADYIYTHYRRFDETARMSLAINLYENVLRGYIEPLPYQKWLCAALRDETDPLISNYMTKCARRTALISEECRTILEETLGRYVNEKVMPEKRLVSLRLLSGIARSRQVCEMLYDIWKNGCDPGGLSLGENDCTSLAYQLMLRFPERVEEIYAVQLGRINNPDRREGFDYICRAVSPVDSVRRQIFESFSTPEGRRPESRVLTALSLLCSPMHPDESITYIRPALELLPEVHKYGDIFFPSSWCKTLLSSQISEEAREEVASYLKDHPDLNPLLRTKVEQAAGRIPNN